MIRSIRRGLPNEYYSPYDLHVYNVFRCVDEKAFQFLCTDRTFYPNEQLLKVVARVTAKNLLHTNIFPEFAPPSTELKDECASSFSYTSAMRLDNPTMIGMCCASATHSTNSLTTRSSDSTAYRLAYKLLLSDPDYKFAIIRAFVEMYQKDIRKRRDRFAEHRAWICAEEFMIEKKLCKISWKFEELLSSETFARTNIETEQRNTVNALMRTALIGKGCVRVAEQPKIRYMIAELQKKISDTLEQETVLRARDEAYQCAAFKHLLYKMDAMKEKNVAIHTKQMGTDANPTQQTFLIQLRVKNSSSVVT